MNGAVAALYRHPVKGFTPEPLSRVALAEGSGVPFDRVFAVEDGPSGFDPAAPAHISKQRFTVLAKIPKVARLRTRFNETTGEIAVETDEGVHVSDLSTETGRAGFAANLEQALTGDISGPVRMLEAPGAHRFYDHPQGDISLINLASVRDLERQVGRKIDPLRFRANVHVDGWPAWIELDAQHMRVMLGGVECAVISPTRRCAATHVDPDRGVRDIDVVGELHKHFGHANCGAYLRVVRGGTLSVGEPAQVIV